MTNNEGETPSQRYQRAGETLSQRYQRAIGYVDSDPAQAVNLLVELQRSVAALSLFSSNEELNEISTQSLPFLELEHHLAMALLQVPTGPQQLSERLQNLERAQSLWGVAFDRFDSLDLLNDTDKRQVKDLLELAEDSSSKAVAPVNRDAKIARFREKQSAQQDRSRLQALMERRKRLGIADHDEMDGHDWDSLVRTSAMASLQIVKMEAMEEYASVLRERTMLRHMLDSSATEMQARSNSQQNDARARPPPPPSKPLQLTHITQDAMGELQVRREELRGQVFRPGWNQPTMSLEELAQREVQQAMEREERQKSAEAAQSTAPRRYQQLVKDGMEDDVDLVNASAELDRKWDDWKDENPRGSGNKRGNVGDKNF